MGKARRGSIAKKRIIPEHSSRLLRSPCDPPDRVRTGVEQELVSGGPGLVEWAACGGREVGMPEEPGEARELGRDWARRSVRRGQRGDRATPEQPLRESQPRRHCSSHNEAGGLERGSHPLCHRK